MKVARPDMVESELFSTVNSNAIVIHEKKSLDCARRDITQLVLKSVSTAIDIT